MRRPGIATLHAVTTTNALHFAFQHDHDETRRLLLHAAFVPQFAPPPGWTRSRRPIDDFDTATWRRGPPPSRRDFADVGRTNCWRAKTRLARLRRRCAALHVAAQRMIYLKEPIRTTTSSVRPRWSYWHLSPQVRNRFLAASVFWLKAPARGQHAVARRGRRVNPVPLPPKWSRWAGAPRRLGSLVRLQAAARGAPAHP